MSEKKITVLDLISLDLPGQNSLELTCIAGRRGLSRSITAPDLNRPGLALTGFFEAFAPHRVQIFGKGETAYLQNLQNEQKTDTLRTFFSYELPCCIFSNNRQPSDDFLRFAEEAYCPVLQTPIETTDFSSRLMRIFTDIFAPSKTIHGVLVEVYGVGILLTGHSGVGKSETALELVERGHRLVADDIVEIRCINGNSIIGKGANVLISHHMEIRGLGIINIQKLYGIGAVLTQKEIQLVVMLEEWDNEKNYDRLGIDQQKMDLLGVSIPAIDIPVKPGRNLPIIIEAAAMNERLKSMGYNSAVDFNQNILKWIETGTTRHTLSETDDVY